MISLRLKNTGNCTEPSVAIFLPRLDHQIPENKSGREEILPDLSHVQDPLDINLNDLKSNYESLNSNILVKSEIAIKDEIEVDIDIEITDFNPCFTLEEPLETNSC